MKTKEMLNMLARQFSGFYCHPLFLKELKQILEKNVKGKEAQLFKQLTAQLENIKCMGRLVSQADHNEIIKGADGHYYSIHLENSQYNVRLLIYITDNSTPYFLCAFYERSGKSYTDYSKHISVLAERLNQMLGDE